MGCKGNSQVAFFVDNYNDGLADEQRRNGGRARPHRINDRKQSRQWRRGTDMAAYIVFMRDKMRDAAEFGKYMEGVPPTMAGHAVKPLALYGKLETLEGAPIEGAVIAEFCRM